MNATDRLVVEIDRALPTIADRFEADKLRYIRTQITPEGLARRPEFQEDVSHLLAVAREVIRRFAKETSDAA